MKRVVVFVDGFNLYHSLRQLSNWKHDEHLKWVNLSQLCELFIAHKTEKMSDILYFTALCTWDKKKKERHLLYTHLLEQEGVRTIWGKYSRVTRKFTTANIVKEIIPPGGHPPEKLVYETFEEKKTDVNIALKIFEIAMQDGFDRAIIVSGDADIIPAIEMVQKHYPKKKCTILLPWKSKGEEICAVAGSSQKMRIANIEASLFPNEVQDLDGKNVKIVDLYKNDEEKEI